MPVYLTLTVLTVSVAALTQAEAKPHTKGALLNRVCIAALFVMLFAVGAFRDRVGNDYTYYTNIMNEIDVHGFLPHPYVPTETGFNLLVWCVYRLTGYQNYHLVFAILNALTVGLFLYVIRKQSVSFFQSFLFFMLLCYYFQSFSTIRYYVALPMVLCAMPSCIRGDWPRFLLIVLLAAFFHKSALFVLVLYPVATLKWNRIFCALLSVFGASLLLFPAFWMEVALTVFPTYRNAPLRGDESSPLNIVRCVLVLLLVLWVYRANRAVVSDRRILFYTKLTLLALMLYVCAYHFPQLSRIGYYLTAPQILLVPALLKALPDEKKRVPAAALAVLFCLLFFVRYMLRAGDDGVLILPYRSLLFPL